MESSGGAQQHEGAGMQTQWENVFDLDPDASYRFKQELFIDRHKDPINYLDAICFKIPLINDS